MKKSRIIKWEKLNLVSEVGLRDRLLTALWNSGAILLLIFSAIMTITRIAPDLRLEGRQWAWIIAAVIGTVLTWEVIAEMIVGMVKSRKIRALLWIVFFVLFLFLTGAGLRSLILRQQIDFEDGLLYLANQYIDQYNLAFNTKLHYPGGKESFLSLAVFLCALIAFFGCYLLSGLGKKKMAFAALPMIMLIAVAVVGLMPGWPSLMLTFVGIFMLSRSKKRAKIDFPLDLAKTGIVFLILILSGHLLADPAKNVLDYSERAKELQKGFESNVSGMFRSTQVYENRTINNESPQYKDARVMKVRTKVKPLGNLYYKTFYSWNYVDGVWQVPEDDFEELCAEQGFDPAWASELSLQSMQDEYVFENEYSELMGTNMLLPYGAKTDEIEGLSLLGDSVFQKPRWQRKLSYRSIYSNELTTDKIQQYSNVPVPEISEEKRKFREWYFSYVQTKSQPVSGYAKILVGQGFSAPRQIAGLIDEEVLDMLGLKDEVMGQLNGTPLDEVIFYYDSVPNLGGNYVTIYSTDIGYVALLLLSYDTPTMVQPVSNAYYILQETMTWINSVAGVFRKAYTYSWDLEELDETTDPIKYFLGISHEGYCEHFASAATLILREYGLPVRFASGYVLKPSMFVEREDGTFEAEMLDRNAHAWVELYVCDVGWIPLEMTPGYEGSSKAFPAGKQEEEERKQKETEESTTPSESEETRESTSEEPEETEKPSEPLEEPASEEESSSEAEEGYLAEDGGKDGSMEGTEDHGSVLRIIVILLLLSGMAGAIYLFLSQRNRRLERALQDKNYRSAICMLNHEIYGKILPGNRVLNDREYEEALLKRLGEEHKAEIADYMAIVRSAVFSQAELTEKDYEIVKDMQQRIRNGN